MRRGIPPKGIHVTFFGCRVTVARISDLSPSTSREAFLAKQGDDLEFPEGLGEETNPPGAPMHRDALACAARETKINAKSPECIRMNWEGGGKEPSRVEAEFRGSLIG